MPRKKVFPAGDLLQGVSDGKSLEDDAYFLRRAEEICDRLSGAFAMEPWKVEAWKLRALEGRGIGGIRMELRRLGVRVGKIRIKRAI